MTKILDVVKFGNLEILTPNENQNLRSLTLNLDFEFLVMVVMAKS